MGSSPTTDSQAEELADLLLEVMVPGGLPDSDDDESFESIATVAEPDMQKVDRKVRKQGV